MSGERQITFQIEGVVQGVGFRPALYRLTVAAGLGGWIQNCSGRVVLALEGEEDDIRNFIRALPEKIPCAAKIDNVEELSNIALVDKTNSPFEILDSGEDETRGIVIPADIAMCDKCRKEILDPTNRRFGYPFTTCVDCGPRYTIINTTPYDRVRTSMNKFPMCDSCEEEYRSPGNRRFHAETVACADCGPKLSLYSAEKELISNQNPIKKVRKELSDGKIVAIQGIGGFHLVTDAKSAAAVQRLRERKKRPHKPFAVMARHIDIVKSICHVSEQEEAILCSPEAPIVVLDLKVESHKLKVESKSDHCLSHFKPPAESLDYLSPDTNTLGVMLPYSPLHLLLFESLGDDETPPFEILVMTSGNRGGEPICLDKTDAFERLDGIADFYLVHDREILLRNDDSLVTLQDGEPQIWRRARGFAPNPLKLAKSFNEPTLAMGAELKNTISIAYDNQIVCSPHVGDLETLEALEGLERVAQAFPAFLRVKPQKIVVDSHPDMRSTRLGEKLAVHYSCPIVRAQHHHAHAAAAMNEHRLDEALALVFDGTGLGDDGSIWGAELLYVDAFGYKRLATFAPVSLPGGDSAVKQPKRQLFARWIHAGFEPDAELLEQYNITKTEAEIWKKQCENGLNAPLSHAAGRLFDAFSALLKISPEHVTYEGQAAIRLEAIAKDSEPDERGPEIPFETFVKDGLFFVDWTPVFREYKAEQWLDEYGLSSTAMAFHRSVREAGVKMIEHGLAQFPRTPVVLSGGVFMNKILNSSLVGRLRAINVPVFTHKRIPPNDGGISIGQAIVAG